MTGGLQALGRVAGETAEAVAEPRAEREIAAARERLVGAREGTVALGRELATSQDQLLAYPGDDTLARARQRLLAGRRRAAGLPGFVRLAVPLAVCLLIAVAIIFGLRAREPQRAATATAVSYLVGARAGTLGERVSAFAPRLGAAPAPELRFSDGSTVDLERASSARVTALDARGAEVDLERGAARVFVNPRRITRWTLHAGPFTVHVVGTRFRLAWDASTKRFSLQMTKGKVRVEGPTIGERQLVAGQRLDVDLSQRVSRAQTAAAKAQPSARPLAAQGASGRRHRRPVRPARQRLARTTRARRFERDEPMPAATPAPAPATATPAPAPAPARPTTLARALQHVGAGRFCQANGLLDDKALSATLAKAPAKALLALGDAARYCSAQQRARTIYLALWRRFARSPSAAAAALALARLSHTKGASALQLQQAERWLQRVSAANGASAAQQRIAAARRVELAFARKQTRRACALAREFLARWSAGSAARYVKQVAVRCKLTPERKRR